MYIYEKTIYKREIYSKNYLYCGFFFKVIYIYKLFYSIILPIKIEGRKLH